MFLWCFQKKHCINDNDKSDKTAMIKSMVLGTGL